MPRRPRTALIAALACLLALLAAALFHGLYDYFWFLAETHAADLAPVPAPARGDPIEATIEMLVLHEQPLDPRVPVPLGDPTRRLLALGGRWWLQRRFASTLDRLASELGEARAVDGADAESDGRRFSRGASG